MINSLAQNISNLTALADKCFVASTNRYTAECLAKWFCPQMPLYIRNYGIAILAVEILANILIWALGKWSKPTPGLEIRKEWKLAILYLPLDFKNPLVRSWWRRYIQELFTFACAIYILVVVSWSFG